MSAVLRSNAKPSLRALAIMGGREWHGRGWSRLEYCVRTGKQALDQVYGAHIFEYLKHDVKRRRPPGPKETYRRSQRYNAPSARENQHLQIN